MQRDNSVSLWVTTLRGGYVESMSRVLAVALRRDPGQPSGETTVYRSGDPQQPVFWRSAAKFVQALSLFQSGAADKFAMTDEEIALACASHSGGPEHVAGVARLLEKIGKKPDDLHCGPHAPLGAPEAAALKASGEAPTRLHNNCSGKHTGMIASCIARGWPIADYNRIHHPLQQEILATLATVASVPVSQIQTAVDGCGAAVFRTPLHGLARAYMRFLAGELPAPHREAGQRILAAQRTAPAMVAGEGRLCTQLIRVTGGRLVGKVGADGVYGVGSAEDGGQGLAIKIADGNSKLSEPVLCQLLYHLGWLKQDEHEALRSYYDLPIYNHQRELVGEIKVEIA
jgi:L-asparaginase II